MQISNYVSSNRYTSYESSRKTKNSSTEQFSLPGLSEKEEAVESRDVDTRPEEDYHKFISEKINEILEKIRNGETEPTYQIGAQSFTEKEWDKFLEKFDSIEETIQELIREEQARKEAEQVSQIQTEQTAAVEDNTGLLTEEATWCSYPAANPNKGDIRYITWYTEEGIFCRKAGQNSGYEWLIAFEQKGQYDKAMELISRFPSDWNLRFAAHENFWTDFLKDEIDMDKFMEFMNSTNKGIPDYSVTVGDSMYIDREKIQWAKYFNSFGNKFYTAEEFQRQQMEIVAANASKKTKIENLYGK